MGAVRGEPNPAVVCKTDAGAEGCQIVIQEATVLATVPVRSFQGEFWWGTWAERADTNHLSQLSPQKDILSVRGWFITQTEICVHPSGLEEDGSQRRVR